MKISDIPLFYQTLPFYGKNLEPFPFWESFEDLKLKLYKEGWKGVQL